MRALKILIPFALLAAATACDRNAGGQAAAAAPPALRVPVGPVPGPAEARFTSNPYAGNAVAVMEGRQLFKRMNCAGCHGDHAGGGMGPSLRDESWIYGGSETEIYASISEGRAHGMPAWGTMINSEQAWKLAAYIKTLRTPEEPEPPTP